MVFAVVTGGGTSGHVIPAQAILEALRENGVDASQLKYVGSRRGIEKSLMKSSEIESVFLPISGLQRSFGLRSLARNIALLWRLPQSRLLAGQLVRKWKPRVVVSVGGYASQPMASAARANKVPLVCVSYDRIAGLATKRQARYATVCAVAFDDTNLPRAVHTGAPVRAELRHLDVESRRVEARRTLDINPDARCVSIVGGSLGSGILNASVSDIATALAHLNNVVIFHVCGPRHVDDPMPHIPDNVRYIRTGYESRMADLYAATDVLVCRAGASTIAEIVTVGIASVVVPWSHAAENHQELNASWLSSHEAATVLTEEDFSSALGRSVIVELVENEQKRRAIAHHAYQLGALHRGKTLVQTIQNATR